ncbi:MAG: hypothetical protein V1721_03170 [Pseudomonadota bacterium]
MNGTATGQTEGFFSNFVNPPERREIRRDFPKTVDLNDTEGFLKTLDQELRKQGTSLAQVKRITLAYPHKHPVLHPDHYNPAENTVDAFKCAVERAAPHIQWDVFHELCDTVSLGRAENQNSDHALMHPQVYEIYTPPRKKPLPFIDRPHQGKEFFVIVDATIEQGTTAANLMSVIEHNWGPVLAISAFTLQGASLAQESTSSQESALSGRFNDASRNTGRLPELAQAFSDSAKKCGFDWPPSYCMEKFNEALKNTYVKDPSALTDGECRRIIETVNGSYRKPESFPSLLKRLDPQFEAETGARPKSANGTRCAPAIR